MPSQALERTRLREIWFLLAGVLILCFSNSGNAAQIKKAVAKARSGKSVAGAESSAVLYRTIRDNTTVRTDGQSRTELMLADRSIARLWAHTILDIKDGGRSLFLQEGALFVDVPMGTAPTRVRGGEVEVDLSAAMALFEYQPKVFKLVVLSGTARLYRPNYVGDSVLVNAGQLVFGSPTASLSDPADFDIKHFLQTSRFLNGFRPLPNQGLIASEIQKQGLEKSQKVLIETNLMMYGGGTTVSATGSPAGKDSPTSGPSRTASQ